MLPPITSGDSWQSLQTLAAYPATSGWVAKLRLTPRASGDAVIDLVASASGADHLFSASAATTANWVAGQYTAVLWAEQGASVATVSGEQLVIKPNLRTITAGYDGRTLARKTLDDLLAARAAWSLAQGGVQSYSVNGRQQEFKNAAELDREITFWQGQLASETAAANLAAGLRPKNQIYVRFTRPR